MVYKTKTKTPQNCFLKKGLCPLLSGAQFAGQAKIFTKFIFGTVFISLVLFNFSLARADYSAGTLVSMTNSARAREGLGALSVNSLLTSAAYNKAQDMLENQYFAHTSPQGETPWDFIKSAGYNYVYAGENLAIGYTDAGELFSAWMASTTHRENIFNPNFREIGIAVVSGSYEGQETIFVAQEFGTPAGAPASEVASENTESQNPTTQSPTPSTVQDKNFEFVKEKSSFIPKSIYAGEEVNFTVTIIGEVQTLEIQAFDQRINLLEASAAVTESATEKTYAIKEKMEKDGSSEVKIIAKDKYGNEEDLLLGQLEVKPTTIAKDTTAKQTGWFAGVKEKVKNNWIYLIIFSGIILALAAFLVFRKIKFRKLAKLGLSSWEL